MPQGHSQTNTTGSFVFESCCGQIDKQTDPVILPGTPTDSVDVGNKTFHLQQLLSTGR